MRPSRLMFFIVSAVLSAMVVQRKYRRATIRPPGKDFAWV